MLVGGDFERVDLGPERAPIDTFDRVCLGVLAAFPVAAAVRLATELLALAG
jgi:hypothetical protein